jgi:hypothetical protein
MSVGLEIIKTEFLHCSGFSVLVTIYIQHLLWNLTSTIMTMGPDHEIINIHENYVIYLHKSNLTLILL